MTSNNSNSVSAGSKHKRALMIVFTITSVYLIAEVIVGIASNSLALLSDAAHMLTDVGGQALALFAIWMSSKSRDNKKTYGYYRIEIFSALINAVVLLFISGYILFEAWQRFKNVPSIAGVPMLIVASLGLVVNLVSMKILTAGAKESINIKGAFLEVISDMLSSVGVIIAGIVILITGWLYIDPIISVLIGLFILPRTFKLLKESVDILLEGTPKDIEYEKIEQFLKSRSEILEIHDLHIWTITSGIYALSVHIIMDPRIQLDAVSQINTFLKSELKSQFKIEHATIEAHVKDNNYKPNII